MDKSNDLALLEVKDDKLPEPIKVPMTDNFIETQDIFVLGFPFGKAFSTGRTTPSITITKGIISSKRKDENDEIFLYQIDGDINPGNSGGPLFNIRGEVVGINTAIVAHGRGIGFAIPIDLARNILIQLEKAGKVTRGWLGVSIQKIDPLLAESFGLEESKGALVAEVMKDSPASKAGIRRGDVIIEFDGQVEVVSSLERNGETVPLTAPLLILPTDTPKRSLVIFEDSIGRLGAADSELHWITLLRGVYT